MRVVFLTRSNEIHSPIILEAILKDKRFQVPAVVVSAKLSPKESLLQDVLYAIKKSGLRYVLARIQEQLYFRLYPLFRAVGFDKLKGQRVVAIEKFATQHGLPLLKMRGVNNRESVEKIRELRPDILLMCFFSPILGNELMKMPSIGCVNVHRALLPKYRGVMPTVWVLAKGERETGVTVHLISDNPKEIDSGWLLGRKKVKIGERDTVNSLSCKLAKAGGSIICQALWRAKNKTRLKKLAASAKYYTWPPKEVVNEFIARNRKIF